MKLDGWERCSNGKWEEWLFTNKLLCDTNEMNDDTAIGMEVVTTILRHTKSGGFK